MSLKKAVRKYLFCLASSKLGIIVSNNIPSFRQVPGVSDSCELSHQKNMCDKHKFPERMKMLSKVDIIIRQKKIIMITIKSYNDYRDVMKAFKSKKLNLLTVVSRGGLGKTFISEEELTDEAPLIFTGHVTPLSLYKTLYEKSKEDTEFIAVFDDVDALMLNKTNVALLKQICDTRETKTIKYFTASPLLGSTPSEFETKCKVLMLMNDLKPEDKNLQALMTRSDLLEIHNLLVKYKTNTEREKHFKGSRMTFYRKLKILISKNPQLKKTYNVGRVK